MTTQYPLLYPSEFVAVVNQTLEYAYPVVAIDGELSNLKISKNRWLYFDLKDDQAKVSFFGTVYNLPGPLEEGMILRVVAQPRLSPLYGFSLNILNIALSGEGSIKKAHDLLKVKLTNEGLFAQERKRSLPSAPTTIGLITSGDSAAYADFIKIVKARWSGLEIFLADVSVQGDQAAEQIVRAIEHFNKIGNQPEVLVLIRGGGSSDDLQAFSTEVVTRAVASSRIPTLVAIGHETDTSLAELAADMRASTPSNAAELLVPDKAYIEVQLNQIHKELYKLATGVLDTSHQELKLSRQDLDSLATSSFEYQGQELEHFTGILKALNPENILKRGYAVVRSGGKVIRTAEETFKGQVLDIRFIKGEVKAKVQ